jgi:hypothetical protein
VQPVPLHIRPAFAENRGARALVAKLGAPRFGPVRSGVASFEVPVFAAPLAAAA